VRQFLDIGTGLPTMQNTHEAARAAVPDSKIVYLDDDPVVLAHARALLTSTTSEGVTSYVDADYREPETIISDARTVPNFSRPVAVMFMGVLGHLADFDEMRSIVSRVMAAVPPGSHLLLRDGVEIGEAKRRVGEAYADTGAVRYHFRTVERPRECFDGLELVEPGLVSISWWARTPRKGTAETVGGYGAMGRKL
jgi:uncharacterized SAM-dependent methyltransferase